jgi:uncharacterized protein
MGSVFERVRTYAQKNNIKKVGFTFTGGEVLLLGHDYLSTLFSLARRIYHKPGPQIKLGLQTNATLIDGDYIELFKKYRINPGISFDVFGSQRRFKNGESMGQTVIDRMMLLLKNKIDFGVLVVINRNNYRRAKEMYQVLDQAGITFNTLDLHPWSYEYCPQLTISRENYVRFLKDLAKVYLANRIGSLEVFKRLLTGGPEKALFCGFAKYCLVGLRFIENNGDVYPCDTLRFKELYLGNILRDPLEKIMSSPVLAKLKGRAKNVERQCRECKYVRICSGGCMAYAYMEGDIMHKSKNACQVYKAMFEYFEKYLRKNGQEMKYLVPAPASSGKSPEH